MSAQETNFTNWLEEKDDLEEENLLRIQLVLLFIPTQNFACQNFGNSLTITWINQATS